MTDIEWTKGYGRKGETWNPFVAYNRETGKRGWFCTKPSAECAHCYAESWNKYVGNHLAYTIGNLEKVEIKLDPKTLLKPFHWRQPRMVFPCSMTDLFLEAHSDWMIAWVVAVMALTPRHIYQVLTKRPERARDLFSSLVFRAMVLDVTENDDDLRQLSRFSEMKRARLITDWPLPNMWTGATIGYEGVKQERLDALKATPAAVRWLSLEPLLSKVELPVDIASWLHWAVVGLESGVKAREGLLSHVEDVIAQCEFYGLPLFVKQLGRNPFDDTEGGTNAPLILKDIKGVDPLEWPEWARVRQYPTLPIL